MARTSGAEESQFGEPQPRRLIITIYGLYGRDEHNWLSVASLVRLMSDLGVDGQSVRSSVSSLVGLDRFKQVAILIVLR